VLRGLIKSDATVDGMGFRLRGLEMTRLETFVDAAFAFSVTMLALSPDKVPGTFDEMVVLFKGIPAFLASLTLLLLFWGAHVRMSRRYGLDDGMTMLLAGAFIAVMLVYVYPLKFMIGSFFEGYVPPLRTPTYAGMVTSAADLSTMFIVMSSGFIGMHVVLMLNDIHALRVRSQLELSAHETKVVKCEIGSACVYIAIGLVSVALALVFRNSGWVVSAGFVYVALAGVMPLYWTVCGPSKSEIAEAKALVSG